VALVSTAAKSSGGAGSVSLIQSQVLGADAANIDFTGIAGTFTDLMFSIKIRGAVVAAGTQMSLTLNGDGGANYTYVRVDQSASATTPGGTTGTSVLFTDNVPAASTTAGHFWIGEMWLPGYSSTVWRKQGLLYGSALVAALLTNTGSFQWANTAAITRVTFTPASGNWLAGSAISLYGIT
jgi:hypothetical protein